MILITHTDVDRDYALVAPRVKSPKITAPLMRKIASALVTRLSALNACTKADLIPRKRAEQLLESCYIESWGRLRALWGGDTMLASELVLRESHDRRDATFVKVCGLHSGSLTRIGLLTRTHCTI